MCIRDRVEIAQQHRRCARGRFGPVADDALGHRLGPAIGVGAVSYTHLDVYKRQAENLDGDIEIEFVGLRPGEKLYEELLIGSGAAKTSHPSIMMANETFMPTEELDKMLAQLAERISAGSDTGEIMEIMELLVPDFDHRPLH